MTFQRYFVCRCQSVLAHISVFRAADIFGSVRNPQLPMGILSCQHNKALKTACTVFNQKTERLCPKLRLVNRKYKHRWMKFVILGPFLYRIFFRPRGGDDGAQGPGPVSAWRCSLGRNELRDLQFTAIVVAHELGPLVSFSEGVNGSNCRFRITNRVVEWRLSSRFHPSNWTSEYPRSKPLLQTFSLGINKYEGFS